MKKLIVAIFVSMFFIACGSGGSSGESRDTSFNDGQKEFLYKLFKTEYLWADETEDKSYEGFTKPKDMIRAFRNKNDKWSYAQTIDEYEDWQSQKTQGFGCYGRNAKIYKMRFSSPCEKAGLKRGDKILKINGEEFSNKVYYKVQNNIGVKSIFTIKRNNDVLNIEITPRVYKFKTVKYQVLNQNNTKIGHLIFDSFTSDSIDELEKAFTYFKANNVEELIIDLRYNGGGSLNTASILLDKIAGLNNAGKIQAKLKWNDNYTNKNYNRYFDDEVDDNALDLNRVFFLTTEDSASASEMVINSLKPYMDVLVIGEKTHGKPVGMRGRKKAGLIYWLINFRVLNANDEGNYFDGINTDCSVLDEYLYSRSNKNDALFKSALNYIENGRCD